MTPVRFAPVRSAPVSVVPIITVFDKSAPTSIAFDRLVSAMIVFAKSSSVRFMPDMLTSIRLVLLGYVPRKLVIVNASIILPSMFLK